MWEGDESLSEDGRWDADLLAAIRRNNTLSLEVNNLNWDNARGYLFEESTMTLYFPVDKRHLTEPLSLYEVLVMDDPRVVVRGELRAATSEPDVETQLALARAAGWEEDEARYMLLDQRTQKARRNRHKLLIRDLGRLENADG